MVITMGGVRAMPVHSKPKLKIGPSVKENPSAPCHPERSQATREANGLAESKDPYTLMISSFAARHSPDALRVAPPQMGGTACSPSLPLFDARHVLLSTQPPP